MSRSILARLNRLEQQTNKHNHQTFILFKMSNNKYAFSLGNRDSYIQAKKRKNTRTTTIINDIPYLTNMATNE